MALRDPPLWAQFCTPVGAALPTDLLAHFMEFCKGFLVFVATTEDFVDEQVTLYRLTGGASTLR